MSLANIAIIYKFIQAKMASKHGGTESTNQALANVAIRGTAILITVTMTFIIIKPDTTINVYTWFCLNTAVIDEIQ